MGDGRSTPTEGRRAYHVRRLERTDARRERLVGTRVGHFEIVSHLGQRPLSPSEVRRGKARSQYPVYLMRDTRCGHERRVTYTPRFNGTRRMCGCPNRLPMGEYIGWSWSNPRGGSNVIVYEHKIVMERELGRELFPGETVHHKNGNRSDNRIGNLELWSTSQPAGQRVQDKIDWAWSIIEAYADFRQPCDSGTLPEEVLLDGIDAAQGDAWASSGILRR